MAKEVEDNQDTEEDEEKSMPQSVLQANQAAERLEKANSRLEKNLARLEAAQIDKALGGSTEAGKPQEAKEETPQEYKDKVLSGEFDDPKD